MEKKEFEERLITIEEIKKQTAPLKQELLNELNNTFVGEVANLVNLLNDRDNKFREYLNSLKEFNFNEELTTPSEVFKGIRTVSDEVDPQELAKKAEAMKANALAIESRAKEIESISSHTITSLKRAIGVLAELSILENQIHDMNIEVLQDIDSIYDIGQIASATK